MVIALLASSLAFANDHKEHKKEEGKKEEKAVDCSKLKGEEKTKCEAALAEHKKEEKAH